MRSAARACALLFGLCFAGAAGCNGQSRSEPAPSPPPPSPFTVSTDARQVKATPTTTPAASSLKLVVLLVVDQLPSWTFNHDARYATAGIRRLLDGGVWYQRARYPYASTYTATGHAALGTGTPPSGSGILANTWYRRKRGKVVSAIADPESPVLHLAGDRAPAARGASPVQLRAEGIAEVLRREKQGRSVSIALKARGAILMLGKRPDLAIWYDPRQPAMTTSRYFTDRAPPWLQKLAKDKPVARLFKQVWRPSRRAELATITGIADDAPGEDGMYGLNNRFPHDLGTTDKPAKALRATPAGNQLTLETALAAIEGEALGADEVPDLLAVSFSGHDYAGHYWGQESWERFELFLDTDRAIGELLDALDARVGKGKYAVVMSSDHGATRLVEHTLNRGVPARRVLSSEVRAAATRAARRVLGKGTWVDNVSTSNVYLSATFHAQSPDQRAKALDAIVGEITKVPDIAFAGRTDKLVGGCDLREGVSALACRSLRIVESGEIFFATGPNCLCTSADYKTGTSHGSPNPDDTDVPVIVYAPGRPPRIVKDTVSPLQVAATIAELLGVSPPAHTRALPLR